VSYAADISPSMAYVIPRPSFFIFSITSAVDLFGLNPKFVSVS